MVFHIFYISKYASFLTFLSVCFTDGECKEPNKNRCMQYNAKEKRCKCNPGFILKLNGSCVGMFNPSKANLNPFPPDLDPLAKKAFLNSQRIGQKRVD